VRGPFRTFLRITPLSLIYPDRALEYFQEGQPLLIATLPDFSLDLKDVFSV